VYLKAGNVNVNGMNNYGWTPLRLSSDRDIAELSVGSWGPIYTPVTCEDQSPLHHACEFSRGVWNIKLRLDRGFRSECYG
jgi:hypothetical protein